MAAMTVMSSAVVPKANRVAPFTGLARVALPCTASPSFAQVTVSNKSHAKASAFMVWEPQNNKFFETLSYLPPLSSDAVAKQVDYITRNGWTPALEFSDAEHAYVGSPNCVRFSNGASVNYYDNRYWTMYKLPMFGCTDSGQVLREIDNASKDFPEAYIRLIAFDSKRQVQVTSMLVHRPNLSNPEFRPVEQRSV